MSDNNEDGGESASRGNEWEVVSLTESAYAAAPGPQDAESKDDEKTDIPLEGGETSRALFMSSHFVFPPSQHENLPLEPEGSDDDVAAEFAPTEAEAEATEEEEEEEEEEENTFEGSKDSDESPEIKSLDDKGTEFEETSFADEPSLGGSKIVESLEEDFDAGDIVRSPRLSKGDGHGEEGSGLPCGAWWKRGAASLYSHAKEANTFWSIFIAAAVMGLVILGQHWQQERWQTLQLKWQFNSEKTSRIFGPISRLKDVIVGGHRRGSLIRGSSSREN